MLRQVNDVCWLLVVVVSVSHLVEKAGEGEGEADREAATTTTTNKDEHDDGDNGGDNFQACKHRTASNCSANGLAVTLRKAGWKASKCGQVAQVRYNNNNNSSNKCLFKSISNAHSFLYHPPFSPTVPLPTVSPRSSLSSQRNYHHWSVNAKSRRMLQLNERGREVVGGRRMLNATDSFSAAFSANKCR